MGDTAKRDPNRVPALQGVSSLDGLTPTDIWVDPTTHGILIDAASVYSSTDLRYLKLDQTTPQTILNGAPIFNAGLVSNGNLTFAGTQKIIGGTGTTSDLTLQTTSGVGATGADIHFLVGNNGGTEAMTILNSGKIGIGTTSPTYKLHVSDQTGRVRFDVAHLEIYNATGGTTSYLDFSDTYALIRNRRLDSNLSFGVNDGGSEITAMTIQGSSGNVGIGTTNPSQKLHIVGKTKLYETDGNILEIGDSSTSRTISYDTNQLNLELMHLNAGYGVWVRNSGQSGYGIDSSGTNLNLYANGGPYVSLTSSGLVGIGTTSPGAKLQINTGVDATIGQIIKAAAAQSANLTEWQNSSGGVLAYISSAGAIVSNKVGNSIEVDSSNPQLVLNNTSLTKTYTFSSDGYGLSIYDSQLAKYVQAIQRSTGKVTYGGTDFDGQLGVIVNDAAYKGITIKAASSQTANLQEWQNSSGQIKAAIDANGHIVLGALTDSPSINNIINIPARNWTPTSSFPRAIYFASKINSTITNVMGLRFAWEVNADKTIDDSYSVYIDNMGGTGTLTNQYGLYVTSLTKGTTLNYAIYTNAGLVRFGDIVNTTESYQVDGVQVVGNRVVDARASDTPNSGDATTDGLIDALRDCLISHGLLAAS